MVEKRPGRVAWRRRYPELSAGRAAQGISARPGRRWRARAAWRQVPSGTMRVTGVGLPRQCSRGRARAWGKRRMAVVWGGIEGRGSLDVDTRWGGAPPSRPPPAAEIGRASCRGCGGGRCRGGGGVRGRGRRAPGPGGGGEGVGGGGAGRGWGGGGAGGGEGGDGGGGGGDRGQGIARCGYSVGRGSPLPASTRG